MDDGYQRHQPSNPLIKSPQPDTWPRRSTAAALGDPHPQHSHCDTVLHPSGSQNTNRTSATLTNTHHSRSSVPSSSSVRKGGGLRATFRKIFGSKRGRDTVYDQRSVSGSLVHVTPSANHHPLRKPSFLFDELIRGRALNSHAPNVITPEPSQAPNNGAETIRCFVDGFSRRNSLPSVVLSSQEAQRLDLTLNQSGLGSDSKLFPRPLRRMPHRSLIDSARRKSRSADALRDIALSQNTLQAQERRLSDEIKYWRHSIIEDPLPSFTSGRQEVSEAVEATSSTSSPTSTPRVRHPSKDIPPRPRAFDFSSLMFGNGDATVEQRVTTVEVKLVDLECAIANLQGHQLAPTAVLRNPPRRGKVSQDLSRKASAQSFRSAAIFPKSSFDSFSTESSTSNSKADRMDEYRESMANPVRPERAAPSNASTAVGAQPPPAAQSYAEGEYDRLMSILTREQEARRGLESQLNDLQKQINELRFPAATRGLPTPGHCSTPTPNVLDVSPICPQRHPILPFTTAPPRLRLQKSAVFKEIEGEETDTDDGFLDVYETPTEAGREYGFGMDGPRTSMLVGVM